MPGMSFDRAAEYYDTTRGYAEGSAERIRDAIVRYTGADMATRFLELGIGTGRIALPFIQAGYDYTGVDLSSAMLARLRAKLADNKPYHYDLREADVTNLPFADATFDVIIAVHVLHLVSDWQQAIREARRVLRPGGFLLIAYDNTHDDVSHSIDSPACTPRSVRAQWDEITKALGGRPEQARRSRWWNDEHMNTDLHVFIRSLGASVETVQLAEFQRMPLTARDMVERIRSRMYSSDWQTPDDFHTEAVRRLEQWLAQHCTDIDTPVRTNGTFEVLSARWPTSSNKEDAS